jgi:hypothetical protein
MNHPKSLKPYQELICWRTWTLVDRDIVKRWAAYCMSTPLQSVNSLDHNQEMHWCISLQGCPVSWGASSQGILCKICRWRVHINHGHLQYMQLHMCFNRCSKSQRGNYYMLMLRCKTWVWHEYLIAIDMFHNLNGLLLMSSLWTGA